MKTEETIEKKNRYRIIIKGAENLNPFDELIKVFLRPDEYELLPERGQTPLDVGNSSQSEESHVEETIIFEEHEDKDVTRQEIYDLLSEKTGLKPKWGIMTGIRPVKLFGMIARESSADKAKEMFAQHYRVSAEKTELAEELYDYQTETFGEADDDSCGIYIGIPFCPTRCLYCSFASNPADDDKIERYLDALHKEIDACGQLIKDRGWYAESIYVGGGTPTTLNAHQLDELLELAVRALVSDKNARRITKADAYDGEHDAKIRALKEFTVEAGRPDTITSDKITAMLKNGVGRISINPQSMKAETLKAIGRDHTPDDVREAFRIVRDAERDYYMDNCSETYLNSGSDNRKDRHLIINTDIIAGLPGEDVRDMQNTLSEMIGLGADNITVHSLAVKRASRLVEEDRDYHYKQGKVVSEMLDTARKMLSEAAYRPYYLYRQKHMSGAQENTGYCLDGTASIYNVRIMDEHQRIIAMGAGGISKAYDPVARTLSRVPNVTNQEIYASRIGEMIERKRDKF